VFDIKPCYLLSKGKVMSEELKLLTAMCEALDLKVERNVDCGEIRVHVASVEHHHSHFEIGRDDGMATMRLHHPVITYKVTKQ